MIETPEELRAALDEIAPEDADRIMDEIEATDPDAPISRGSIAYYDPDQVAISYNHMSIDPGPARATETHYGAPGFELAACAREDAIDRARRGPAAHWFAAEIEYVREQVRTYTGPEVRAIDPWPPYTPAQIERAREQALRPYVPPKPLTFPPNLDAFEAVIGDAATGRTHTGRTDGEWTHTGRTDLDAISFNGKTYTGPIEHSELTAAGGDALQDRLDRLVAVETLLRSGADRGDIEICGRDGEIYRVSVRLV